MALAFIPGYPSSTPRLLERFLPPLAEGVAAHYIQQHSEPGDLIFDPFGAAPSVAVEALALDRRVVVAGFNPVTRLALSLAVRPPSIAQLRSALTLLADAPTGREPGQRLEGHVRSLYQTTCAECEGPAMADSYEWDADVGEPVEKIYVCPNCGGPRQSPTDDADRALAHRYTRTGLDYYFLLDRVAPLNDPDRPHAEEALSVYPARTLAAISSILNRLDALSVDRETRRLLAGLLVAALDQAVPLAQERPRALAVPRRGREINFWLALERALGTLAGTAGPDQSLDLDELLRRGTRTGVYAHAGSVRALAAQLPPGACGLLLSAIPRPNQAYWTLSAVWSAWIWGRQSAEALRAAMRRRRHDWAWHANALQRTLEPLPAALRLHGRLVSLVPEAEPGFSGSVLAAAAGAGFVLEDAALRADTAEAQVVWAASRATPTASEPASDGELRRAARESMLSCLAARSEPARWSSLHFAAWTDLARQRLLRWNADDPLATVNRAIDNAAQNEQFFERLGATADSDPSTGLWCLATAGQPAERVPPLADRVEAEVVRQLVDSPSVDERELQAAVCAALPGVETPGRGLVQAALASYALHSESGLWQLRPEDAPVQRAAEIEAVEQLLTTLGERHGFQVAGRNPQTWLLAGEAACYLAVVSTATISAYVLSPEPPARRCFLILPGGRAGLVEHKLRRDPRLRRALDSGPWCLVKFRHVRRLVADGRLGTGAAEADPAALEAALAGDPVENMQQLALLE